MILDMEGLLSDNQAITATANSTNYYDNGAVGTPVGGNALSNDLGKGNKVPFLIQVTEDFNTLTSLDLQIQVDDNTGFTSAKTVYTQNVLLADLKAGKKVNIDYIPKDANERYLRCRYVVNGTNPTAGRITAGVVAAVQSNT